MNLNHIAIPTVDIAASARFYRTLGLQAVLDGPEYARFRSPDDSTTLSLIPSAQRTGGGLTIYFEVGDVDAEVDRLRSHGLEFVELPRTQPWTWREARLEDPSGTRVCIFRAGASRLRP